MLVARNVSSAEARKIPLLEETEERMKVLLIKERARVLEAHVLAMIWILALKVARHWLWVRVAVMVASVAVIWTQTVVMDTVVAKTQLWIRLAVVVASVAVIWTQGRHGRSRSKDSAHDRSRGDDLDAESRHRRSTSRHDRSRSKDAALDSSHHGRGGGNLDSDRYNGRRAKSTERRRMKKTELQSYLAARDDPLPEAEQADDIQSVLTENLGVESMQHSTSRSPTNNIKGSNLQGKKPMRWQLREQMKHSSRPTSSNKSEYDHTQPPNSVRAPNLDDSEEARGANLTLPNEALQRFKPNSLPLLGNSIRRILGRHPNRKN